jgi:adenylate kinase
MERGVLVPDEVTIKMVMEWIEANGDQGGFILDGFPRTLAQAEALESALADDGGVDKVLYITVSQEELLRRLTGRMLCRDCQTPYQLASAPPRQPGKCDKCGGELYQRPDDQREAVAERLLVYDKETKPLVSYYRNAEVLIEISGEDSIENVGKALTDGLRS